MKTRDRILATSLLLFNQEGEQNVTTVDIANELDISPGNLYYHFKGKESIIEALYANYDAELSGLLAQSLEKELSIEQHWLFIYVLFEEIYKFRFFYLNADSILFKYPEIKRRFRRLLSQKISTIEALCCHLTQSLGAPIDKTDSRLLAENICQSMLYWFAYQKLLQPEMEDEALVHKGVYHVLSLLAPYTGESQKTYVKMIKNLYKTKN